MTRQSEQSGTAGARPRCAPVGPGSIRRLAPVILALVSAVGLALPEEVSGGDGPSFWPWLDPVRIERARLGRVVFEQEWVAAPGRDPNADGLGPLYNEGSCAACHNSSIEAEPALRLSSGAPGGGPHPVLGRQFQTRAIAGLEPEGRLLLSYETVPVAIGTTMSVTLRRPVARIASAEPPVDGVAPASLRMPRELDGIGLIELVSETAIARLADPGDADGDGISGRVRWVNGDDGERVAGRFGWKSDMASLEHQTADALSLDMGLSSSYRPDPAGDCTHLQLACRAVRDGRPETGGHEVSDGLVVLIADYLRALARLEPVRSAAEPPVNEAGAKTFAEIGCARCHVPKLESDGDAEVLDMPEIVIYSDLLLHDMGEGLAELAPANGTGGPTDDAPRPGEWRTAPLAGLSRRVAGDRDARLLHDGRARSIEEAVLWHGGEGAQSRSRYMELSSSRRAELIEYLSGL